MSEKIAVIMSVYNAERTVKAAVESILAQTHSNIEFIICDDASTDDSYQLLQQYAEKDSRIILFKNDVNSKLAYSLNRCLEYVTAEYVARMDSDDMSMPDRLEKQLAFLKKHPECDLVGTAMKRFDDSGFAGIVKQPDVVDKYCMRNGNPFNHATIMTHKRVYDKLGGYTVSERTGRSQDYDLWFRFFAEGFNGYNIDEPLYLVREDIAAIKRRTFNVRYNSYKTTCLGFKLLNFPKHWIIKPTLLFVFKSLTPLWAIKQYRAWGKRKFERSNRK